MNTNTQPTQTTLPRPAYLAGPHTPDKGEAPPHSFVWTRRHTRRFTSRNHSLISFFFLFVCLFFSFLLGILNNGSSAKKPRQRGHLKRDKARTRPPSLQWDARPIMTRSPARPPARAPRVGHRGRTRPLMFFQLLQRNYSGPLSFSSFFGSNCVADGSSWPALLPAWITSLWLA